jgi:hypothetical protein
MLKVLHLHLNNRQKKISKERKEKDNAQKDITIPILKFVPKTFQKCKQTKCEAST